MIDVGSQIVLCDVPIRLDDYSGCSHGCDYCFVKKKYDINKIEADNCIKSVEKWCQGERTKKTKWADWKIPLHFGGMSDPLQPIERKYEITKRILQILNHYQYPIILSTKGELLIEESYKRLISEGNYAIQISHVSPCFDRIERGAPSYERRLEMMEEISSYCKRLIVRVQPYTPACFSDVLKAIPRYRMAGVHGLILEGMKYKNKAMSTVRFFGDFVYDLQVLKPQFLAIKKICHENGLAFYSGENRLRSMGDNLCCCGVSDLEGFKVNEINLNHQFLAPSKPARGPSYDIPGTGSAFRCFTQSADIGTISDNATYNKMFDYVLRSNMVKMVG